MRRASSHPAGRFGEDVFGPVGPVASHRKDVGAIGDGRKRTSPDFQTVVSICPRICAYILLLSRLQHVEQLLRTLNLNSPAPFPQAIGFAGLVPSSASPDVSPISTTSGLHTPPDVSPAKAFGEWKVNHPYDLGSVAQRSSNTGLLFETDYLPVKDAATVDQGPVRVSHSLESLHSAPTRGLPFFESFPERASLPHASDPFSQVDFTAIQRQEGLPTAFPSGPWGPQRLRSASAEWLKPEGCRLTEPASSTSPSDHGLRGTAISHASAHEVSLSSLLAG